MPIQRIPYGVIDGRYINSIGDKMLGRLSLADVITFGNDDLTPDVDGGNLFQCAVGHGADRTITMLDAGQEGQVVVVLGGNPANITTVQDGGNMDLDGDWVESQDAMLVLLFDGTDWKEIDRKTGIITVGGAFTGFVAAESKTLNLTGLSSRNPLVTRFRLYISNDPTGDENIQFRLSFYESDSMTEDELIHDYYLNLSYTETNGGALAGHVTDVVDDVSGLVMYDMIRYLGGTAENVRLTAVPNVPALTLTFTALLNDHANNTGVVRVAEVADVLSVIDTDGSNEIHCRLESLAAPAAAMDVAMEIEFQ